MADNKKFYWLKLQKDFFKRHDITIIEAMDNGKDYILFYLKLLCESVNHNGELRFSETIPYDEKMLAVITRTNLDIVRSAMKVFSQLNMIEVLDDQTIFMSEVSKMIGGETKSAERVRNHRKNQKMLQSNADVTGGNATETKCNTEIEKEIEKELEIDIPPKPPKGGERIEEVRDLYNSTCLSLPRATTTTPKRESATRTLLKNYTLEQIQQVFESAEQSDFLSGKTGNGKWKANFDWLINSNNAAKVLDGNYANKRDNGSFFTDLAEDLQTTEIFKAEDD